MCDHPMAVVVVLVEPEEHAVDSWQNREGRVMHVSRGLGLENLCRAVLPILQMGHHEMRHVSAARCQASGRRGPNDFDGLTGQGGRGVSLREFDLEPFRQRLTKRGIAHLQWPEQMLIEVIIKGLARGACDDVTRECRCIIGVSRCLTGRKNPRGYVAFEKLAQWSKVL